MGHRRLLDPLALAAQACHHEETNKMNNEETYKAKKLAEQAKDRERMARILKEDKGKATRQEDVNPAAARIATEGTEG
jgi:hypothetical protein